MDPTFVLSVLRRVLKVFVRDVTMWIPLLTQADPIEFQDVPSAFDGFASHTFFFYNTKKKLVYAATHTP